jgi:ribosomal peptide maturation radical SAM protein 1
MSAHPALATSPRPLEVALVYPPFGPAGLPSLGLGLLSAAVKARGHRCTTFYWNLDLLTILPGRSASEQARAYWELSNGGWFPFSEWVFTPTLYGAGDSDAATMKRLRRAATRNGSRLSAHDLLELRRDSGRLVDEMADRLARYDIVGIATTFYQNIAALALARVVKQRWPGKLVVLGGANCDGPMGAGLMELFDFVDCAFVGEVDHAFPEFVDRVARGEAVDDLPGIVTRGPGEAIVKGPAGDPVEDLDALPYPDFDDFLRARAVAGLDRWFPRVLPLESSRGCWWGAKNHCTFCGLNALGMAYRVKDWERFRAEVEHVVARYDTRFLFMADNILSMKYYDEYMRWARDRRLGVEFFFEIKANVTRVHVRKLADAGITVVQPGVESFSTPILSLMRKGTSGIQNVAMLRYMREHGVRPSYNLLVGFPGEPQDEYARLARELPKLAHLHPPMGVPKVEFHRFSPYHADPAAFGISLRPSAKYQCLYPFPEERVGQIAYTFERDDEEQPDSGYLSSFLEAVDRWHKAFAQDRCTLTWQQELLDVVITDSRSEFPRRRYRLTRFAAELFRLLDAPASLRVLLREAARYRDDVTGSLLAAAFSLRSQGEVTDEEIIDFSAEEFIADPEGRLRPLVDNGLLFVEPAPLLDQRYLALPVSASMHAQRTDWEAIGV